MISVIIDKPKVVSRSQSQKMTTWFSLKLQCPTTPIYPPPPLGKFQMCKIGLYFQNKSCWSMSVGLKNVFAPDQNSKIRPKMKLKR